MCEYCKPPEVIWSDGELIKGMKIRVNEPLFYGTPEYFGIDPFGIHRFSKQGRPVGIDLLSPTGKPVLTDGGGYIEINYCPVCGRSLTEE